MSKQEILKEIIDFFDKYDIDIRVVSGNGVNWWADMTFQDDDGNYHDFDFYEGRIKAYSLERHLTDD